MGLSKQNRRIDLFKKTSLKEKITTKLFFLHNDYIQNNGIKFDTLTMDVMFDELDIEGQKTHTVYAFYCPLDNNPITLEHETLSKIFNRVIVNSAENDDGHVKYTPKLSSANFKWLNKLHKRQKNESR